MEKYKRTLVAIEIPGIPQQVEPQSDPTQGHFRIRQIGPIVQGVITLNDSTEIIISGGGGPSPRPVTQYAGNAMASLAMIGPHQPGMPIKFLFANINWISILNKLQQMLTEGIIPWGKSQGVKATFDVIFHTAPATGLLPYGIKVRPIINMATIPIVESRAVIFEQNGLGDPVRAFRNFSLNVVTTLDAIVNTGLNPTDWASGVMSEFGIEIEPEILLPMDLTVECRVTLSFTA